MNEFATLAIAIIFSSNVVAVSGVGAPAIQAEKRNFWFMLVSTMCAIVAIILAGLLYYVIDYYLLAKYSLTYLKLFIITTLSVIFTFASRSIIKASTKELFYLYERSYSLPIETVLIIGSLLLIDYSGTFMMTMYRLAMQSVGLLLVEFVFYALYDRLDSAKTLKPARNIPIMLYTLSIISIILYVVGSIF